MSLTNPFMNRTLKLAGNKSMARAVTGLLILASLISSCASWEGSTEEVVFSGGGDIDLYGTIAFPDDVDSPVPAIVMLHGAERATRDRFIYPITGNLFVEQGLAVLTYDKRGAGQSGGDYDTTTYQQLIQDAVAAIAYLRSRPDIDGDRIGVFGVSESGWLAPEIIERSGGVAFLVNKVGSVLSVRETISWEILNDLQAEGISAASAAEQVQIFQRIWAWQENPAEAERVVLQEILDQWRDRTDSRLPETLTMASEGTLADRRYDPGPFLERMTTPSLYLYGSEDINIPSRDCMIRIEELQSRGVPVSGHLFEGEGHELGGPSPLPPFYAFADGYADLIADFAALHTRR